MKVQYFPLVCVAALFASMAANAQLKQNYVYSEARLLTEETMEVANKTNAAIKKLPSNCQELSVKNYKVYDSLNNMLGKPNLQEDARQILMETRTELVWSIETFRRNVLAGKKEVDARACHLGLSSVETIEKQLDQIGSRLR